MDISAIVPSEIIVDILHPVHKTPIGIKVSLISPEDERVKRVMLAVRNDNTRRANAGKPLTAERADENTMKALVVAVTGWEWSGDASFEGHKPECTPGNVEKVCGKLEWFKDQLLDKLNDTTNFLPG